MPESLVRRGGSRGHGAARRLATRASSVAAMALAAIALLTRIASAGAVESAFHQSAAGAALTVDHAAWAKLLQTYVKPQADGLNRVDYARFKAEGRPALTAYLNAMQSIDPTKLDRPEQFAYWANLYNAKTVDIVLEAYPVASIKSIKLGGILSSGPWSKKVLKVNGTELSLDDIEHTILRGYFKDPRVHYTVNCASVGCPNLGTEAFAAARLEQQLDGAARAYVNHPRGIKATSGRIEASSIYKWFVSDFGGNDAGVLTHVKKYAAPPLAQALSQATRIDGFDYDWTLNDLVR